MSHITIIINRAAQEPSATASSTPDSGVTFASVSYVPPDGMSDADVAHEVRKLYKQVKDLGT